MSSVALAPVAHAEDIVTYEIVSDQVTKANVEYYDHSVRQSLVDVPLPWRMNAAVSDPRSVSAEVRADWRSSIAALPAWRPNNWVTVRIWSRGSLLCQNTLDVGNATCYGNTPLQMGPEIPR
ncbi:hypothetical protein BST14_26825 [Mycobacterium arosiense ATCC BAA-1401 = DSM 45069]|uniref:Uncharacterized protein n=1 Tax=Mycobacterium arosiense ATCC BAA-1401 = DSM 45069 TaxID=1265311 RepID=A0A1W9Z5K9_MYCAI|nr:hypothetical protein BST14_26825 [Mycobacterium arosiense ATCC BAA-1401 = DSM 45069]